MMKTKIFSLILLTLMISIGMVSAIINFVDVIGNTQSVNPGSQVIVSFILEEDGYDDISELAFTSPILLSGCSKTFDAPLTITGAPTNLDEGESSDIVSVSFNIPNNQVAYTYNGDLILTGKYATPVNYKLPLSIKVNSVPSLSITDATISSGDDSATIKITNTGNVALSGIALDISDVDGVIFIYDSSIGTLAIGESKDIEVTADISSSLDFGLNKATITATSGTTIAEGIINIEKSYCGWGDQGDLKVKVDINNIKGFGDDEEWYLLDEIEAEIEIENKGDEKIKDIVVEWGLYNSDEGEWIIEEEEDNFDLKSDKDKIITINFKVEDPDDFEEGSNYIFYVRAYSDEEGEDKQCISDSETIEIAIDDDFVVVNDIQIQDVIPCDGELQITADVWNIGESNQEDVYVRIYNQDLGIDERIDVGDIDSLDDKKLNFNFQIPRDVEEKQYTIQFTVYDENDDLYENENNDNAIASTTFRVQGNCLVAPQASISATLKSGGNAGQELVVEAVITNIGSNSATYIIEAGNYDSWAVLEDVSPALITLGTGESQEVLFKFDVNKDISGAQTFNIKVKTGDTEAEILTQPVSITIESGIGGITGGAIGEGNWYLWGIGILNVVLILIIIIVAIRVAKS